MEHCLSCRQTSGGSILPLFLSTWINNKHPVARIVSFKQQLEIYLLAVCILCACVCVSAAQVSSNRDVYILRRRGINTQRDWREIQIPPTFATLFLLRDMGCIKSKYAGNFWRSSAHNKRTLASPSDAQLRREGIRTDRGVASVWVLLSLPPPSRRVAKGELYFHYL